MSMFAGGTMSQHVAVGSGAAFVHVAARLNFAASR